MLTKKTKNSFSLTQIFFLMLSNTENAKNYVFCYETLDFYYNDIIDFFLNKKVVSNTENVKNHVFCCETLVFYYYNIMVFFLNNKVIL